MKLYQAESETVVLCQVSVLFLTSSNQEGWDVGKIPWKLEMADDV
jgi:hypothetical protein